MRHDEADEADALAGEQKLLLPSIMFYMILNHLLINMLKRGLILQ